MGIGGSTGGGGPFLSLTHAERGLDWLDDLPGEGLELVEPHGAGAGGPHNELGSALVDVLLHPRPHLVRVADRGDSGIWDVGPAVEEGPGDVEVSVTVVGEEEGEIDAEMVLGDLTVQPRRRSP